MLERGRPIPAIFGILKGRARVGTAAESAGNDLFFRWYRPGEVLGLVSVIDPIPYPATAVAFDECETLSVDFDTMSELLRRDSGLAFEVARVLARHAWDLCHLLEVRTAPLLKDRVHAALTHLAAINGVVAPDGSQRIAVSQQDLAEAIGASRSRVTKALVTLAAEGRIEQGYRHVSILSRPAASLQRARRRASGPAGLPAR